MISNSPIRVCVAEKRLLLDSTEPDQFRQAEDEEFVTFGDENREAIWRIGRQFVKKHVIDIVGQAVLKRRDDFAVLTRTGLGRGIRPVVLRSGKALPIHLSLSHSDELFGLAISTDTSTYVGVDVVNLHDIRNAPLDFWFTKREMDSLHSHGSVSQRNEQLSLIWSLKEALYKASNFGEPFRPHRWEVVTDQTTVECFHNRLPVELSAFESRLIGHHRVTAVAMNNALTRVGNSHSNTHRLIWQTAS